MDVRPDFTAAYLVTAMFQNILERCAVGSHGI